MTHASAHGANLVRAHTMSYHVVRRILGAMGRDVFHGAPNGVTHGDPSSFLTGSRWRNVCAMRYFNAPRDEP